MSTDETKDNLLLELRRGVIVLAVMSQLETEQYGYSLMNRLSDQDLEIDQGTLYPLLRRLEAQGLLQSVWKVESGHPRRYYALNDEGRQLMSELKNEWARIVTMMQKML